MSAVLWRASSSSGTGKTASMILRRPFFKFEKVRAERPVTLCAQVRRTSCSASETHTERRGDAAMITARSIAATLGIALVTTACLAGHSHADEAWKPFLQN